MLQLRKAIRLQSLGLSVRSAIRTAAEIGAQAIEIDARLDIRPAELSSTGTRELKKMLRDFGLQVCSVYFQTRRGLHETDDLQQRLDALAKTMSMAATLGAPIVANQLGPIPPLDSPEGRTLLDAISDLARHGHRVGVLLAGRTGHQTASELQNLLRTLPEASLLVDFDPAELILHRINPSGVLQVVKHDVAHFRARDATIDRAANRGEEVQLGRGSVDMPELLGILEEAHYNKFITVHRDTDENPVEQCRAAMEFLDNLFR